jgi:hypothetical protein
LSNSTKDNWDDQLAFVEHAINTSIFATTGLTPLFYEYGYDASGPFDNMLAGPPKENKAQFAEWFDALGVARQWSNQHRELAKQKMKAAYDKDKKEHDFQLGEEVWVHWPWPGKLKDKVHGPYVIDSFDDLGSRTATVHHKDEERDRIRVHVDRLMPIKKLPKSFKPDETWKEWVKNAAAAGDKTLQKDLETEPEDMDLRDMEELEQDEYEVEAIIGHRTRKNKGKKQNQYKVRFRGYGPDEDKWIDARELRKTANELVEQYEQDLDEEEGKTIQKLIAANKAKKKDITVIKPKKK